MLKITNYGPDGFRKLTNYSTYYFCGF